MCGRYTLATQLDLLQDRFHIAKAETKLSARYNIAPTQDVPVIIQDDQRTLTAMRWGLVPFWAKDESIGNRMINARAETLADKPSFRKILESRRCIVPADGFYEWSAAKGGRTKVPLRYVVGQGELFGLAGLWDRWKSPDGEELHTFTIITTEPNKLVEPVHNRMPVILRPDDEDEWLDSDIVEPERLEKMLRPYPAGMMRAYEVSKVVNSPSNDSPACITPVEVD